MNPIYKIETLSADCATQIADFITLNEGHCVIQGWAIITDYCFNSQQALKLLALISMTSANVSESDIHHLNNLKRIAA